MFVILAAIWDVVHHLRHLSNSASHHVDVIMLRHMIEYISTLNNVCSDNISVLHSRTHWLM